MRTNLVKLRPAAPSPSEVEPLVAAVLEVSAYVSSLNAGKRRSYTRLAELESGDLSLRRSRPRALKVVPQRPVTFYSIEYASSEATGRDCA